MSAQILNGQTLAESIYQRLKQQIDLNIQDGRRAPCLAAVLVGQDPASEIYVRNKLRACETVSIRSQSFKLSQQTTEQELLALIERLNQDPSVDGILIQLPLPQHIDRQTIIESIRIDKDVDGFHPYNLGRLAQQSPNLRPCTPAGIMTLLKTTHINLEGLNATVVGTSNIVGRPMILELLMAGCTVTAAHSRTIALQTFIENADLLVVAAGSPCLIKGHWIKKGAIVIDVGMNRMDNGKLVGDVEYEAARERAGWITPVPGGVGPMTVATLLSNTVDAYEILQGIAKR